MNHGHYTAEVGRKLRDNLIIPNKLVFFDHGEKGESRHIIPILGLLRRDENGHHAVEGVESELAWADLAVVDKQNRTVDLLCEVEEEGACPKKIIGDLFSVLFADALKIKRTYYSFVKTQIIIGIIVGDGNAGIERVREIDAKLHRMVKTRVLDNFSLEIICERRYELLSKRIERMVVSKFNIPTYALEPPGELSCFSCGSEDIAIIDGKVAMTPDMIRLLDEGKAALGDRRITGIDPRHQCNVCGTMW